MTSSVIQKTTKDNQCYILYDESLIQTPSARLFQPEWLNQQGSITPIGTGRGSAWFVDFENHHWVLRHYLRGGFISRFVKDIYWNPVPNKSRSWHEWLLLKQLYAMNLPVPRPVAACVQSSLGFYRADIIVERIPETMTLASILQDRQLTDNEWLKTGATIRNFHEHNVFHADLNADNILLNSNNDVFIIDFDRGRFKKTGSWKSANLARLKRSLNKLRNKQPSFLYQDTNWQTLLEGYHNNQN